MMVHLDGRQQSFEELVAKAPFATLILSVLALADALKRHFSKLDAPAPNRDTATTVRRQQFRST